MSEMSRPFEFSRDDCKERGEEIVSDNSPLSFQHSRRRRKEPIYELSFPSTSSASLFIKQFASNQPFFYSYSKEKKDDKRKKLFQTFSGAL
jgi:hypothetical protein